MRRIARSLAALLGLLLPPLFVAIDVAWDEAHRNMGEKGFLSSSFEHSMFLQQAESEMANPKQKRDNGEASASTMSEMPSEKGFLSRSSFQQSLFLHQAESNQTDPDTTREKGDATTTPVGETPSKKGFLSRSSFQQSLFLRQAGSNNKTDPPESGEATTSSPMEEASPLVSSPGALQGGAASSGQISTSNLRSCGVTFNATAAGCSRRIEQSGRSDCDCYSFCGNTLAACYSFGDEVPAFSCPVPEVMVGCQEDMQEPEVDLAPGIGAPCPPGYICSKYEQQSCELVRQIPIWLGLGDVHAGMYCPGRPNRIESGYENCDVGYYCPNSTSRISCPEGYFCPHKTEKPEIVCRNCPEGATTLARESYVNTIVVMAVALMAIVVVGQTFMRYNARRRNQLKVLKRRNLDGIRDVAYKRKHLRRMKMLRPKLKVIEKRLRQHYGDNVDDKVVVVCETDDGNISFDAAILFDVLDTQGEDVIPYSKLNKVLKLNSTQLREFIHRTNDAAGESRDTQEVERHIFITQFLPVYSAVESLDPSAQDAANLFDDLARQGTTDTGEIPHRQFFKSRLTEFLTEEQINTILKEFQRTKEFHEVDEYKKEEPKKLEGEDPVVNEVPLGFHQSMFGLPERGFSISRSDFIARYPKLLAEATKSVHSINSLVFSSQLTLHKGIDLAFEKLSVSVDVKDRPVKVINSVSGRLCTGTMTAVMGSPDSGKKSLLYALSGRPFYGSVTGTTLVNGHKSTLERYSSFVGFVPKNDALYAELTVREQFVFSGKLRLREDTPLDEIEDLAEATMASLNLSSVMHERVGHVKHGGLSELQRRCLSIGLEIMAKPRILFLEAPIRDLDPSSALFMFHSLKKLGRAQGMTICSTLHQPRKDCFDLFDSLLLLGVGGKLVYSGPVRKVFKYMNHLNFYLHDGESFTDWVVDIASGRLKPPVRKKKRNKRKNVLPGDSTHSTKTAHSSKSGVSFQLERQPSVKKVMFELAGRVVAGGAEKETVASLITKPFDTEAERAKATCNLLADHLRDYIKGLAKKKRVDYDPPNPYSLPRDREKAHFLDQLGIQLQRLLILAERNWSRTFLDTTILCVAVALVSWTEGVAQPTVETSLRNLNFESVAEPTSAGVLLLEFPHLFGYAVRGIREDIEVYATKVGVIFALIVCINATKKITAHRSQFLSEAADGCSTCAFFIAINVWAISEHAVQAALASMFAFSLRNSLAMWYAFIIQFLMLSWISASWGLLFPLLIPKEHVVKVAGFFISFFGLVFCGAIPPISFEVIYESVVAAIASAFLSPTRFFVEAMAAAEARGLPAQSGFTDLGRNIQGGALEVVSFQILNYGLKDFEEITQQARKGWYWGVLPSLFLGLLIRWCALGALYGSDRESQAKKPALQVLKQRPIERFWLFVFMTILAGLVAATLYFMLR